MLTVAEVPENIRRAEKLLTADEWLDLVDYLAARPRAGVLLGGTGEVRKLRWGLQGTGKSGGARVVHYYHFGAMPWYLLTLLAKTERANLSQADRNGLAALADELVWAWLDR